MATNAAAASPAPVSRHSETSPYVASAQNALKSGAVNTHTCCGAGGEGQDMP